MINIVLYEPEIPENTGNIIRTCVACNFKLHLIGPFGFIFDIKRIKRSSANYVDKLNYSTYIDYDDFLSKNSGDFYFLTRYATKCYCDIDFKNDLNDVYLIFGKESSGIPKNILQEHLESCYRIPMSSNVRALNLSNCVAIVSYEVLRQNNFIGLLCYDSFKGKEFLNKID